MQTYNTQDAQDMLELFIILKPFWGKWMKTVEDLTDALDDYEWVHKPAWDGQGVSIHRGEPGYLEIRNGNWSRFLYRSGTDVSIQCAEE